MLLPTRTERTELRVHLNCFGSACLNKHCYFAVACHSLRLSVAYIFTIFIHFNGVITVLRKKYVHCYHYKPKVRNNGSKSIYYEIIY